MNQIYEFYDKQAKTTRRFMPKRDEIISRKTGGGISTFFDTLNFPQPKRENIRAGIQLLEVPSNTDAIALTQELRESDALAGSADVLPAFLDEEGNSRYFVPRELTVQFNELTSIDTVIKIVSRFNCKIVKKQRTPGYFVIEVPQEENEFAILQRITRLNDVKFAEPNELSTGSELIGASEFSQLWGLRNRGQLVAGVAGKSGADINVLPAWGRTRGENSVVIAIVDTGIDSDHPDLVSALLHRNGEDWDFADEDDEPDDESLLFHGTHICGTVAAIENGDGVVGVAPGCLLMPLRVNLRFGFNADRVDAINYAADKANMTGLRIVLNCSWKTNGYHSGIDTAVKKAISNGVIVVAAAGNSRRDIDRNPVYPAIHGGVIAVGATNSMDQKYRDSNYGSRIDVCAPGVNIWSTIGGGGYGFKDGTSMAAAYVSGVTALMLSVNPALSSDEVKMLLKQSCRDISTQNRRFTGKLGAGCVNAGLAVELTSAL